MRLGLISGKLSATERGTLMRLGNDRPENSISKSHGWQRERGGKLCIGRMLTLVANSPKSHKSLVFGLAPMDLQGERCRNTGRK
jgi:hypothetical protein